MYKMILKINNTRKNNTENFILFTISALNKFMQRCSALHINMIHTIFADVYKVTVMIYEMLSA